MEQRKHRLTPSFIFFSFGDFIEQKKKRKEKKQNKSLHDLILETEDAGEETSSWWIYFNKPSNRNTKLGNLSLSKQTDTLQSLCDLIVSLFLQPENLLIRLSSPLDSFVLRSEHDNLQIVRVVKRLYVKGRIQVV